MRLFRSAPILNVLFIFLALCSTATNATPDIEISRAESQLSNDILTISADAKINLSKDPTEALQSGVPLFFDLNIEIRQKRNYIWDQELFKTKYTYLLQRHTLSKKYIVKNLITDTQEVHGSVTAAIQSLGKIRKLAVVDVKELINKKNLALVFELKLKINALPAPMMPLAYISPQWHISSKKYKWDIDL